MKYRVTIPLHASTYIDIEADSKEEALSKALEQASEPSLCWCCAKEVQIDSINDEAMDGLDLVDEVG